MTTTHDTEKHSCGRMGCVPASKRPESWKPTIGPIRHSKGLKRQEARVARQKLATKRNEERYQNGTEWQHG